MSENPKIDSYSTPNGIRYSLRADGRVYRTTPLPGGRRSPAVDWGYISDGDWDDNKAVARNF